MWLCIHVLSASVVCVSVCDHSNCHRGLGCSQLLGQNPIMCPVQVPKNTQALYVTSWSTITMNFIHFRKIGADAVAQYYDGCLSWAQLFGVVFIVVMLFVYLWAGENLVFSAARLSQWGARQHKQSVILLVVAFLLSLSLCVVSWVRLMKPGSTYQVEVCCVFFVSFCRCCICFARFVSC